MPGKISRELIAKMILSGINKAHKDYEEWSGGDWLWNAPEYLLTTYIARSIADIDCTKYITLENSASDAIKDAGAFTRGRLSHKARPNGRIDILLWWGAKCSPRAVIEVKHNVYSYAQLRHDVDRIENILVKNQANSSLQFGALAFYIVSEDSKQSPMKTASKRIRTILDNIEEAAKDDLSESFQVKLFTKLHEEEDSAWTAACLMLIPKRSYSG